MIYSKNQLSLQDMVLGLLPDETKQTNPKAAENAQATIDKNVPGEDIDVAHDKQSSIPRMPSLPAVFRESMDPEYQSGKTAEILEMEK